MCARGMLWAEKDHRDPREGIPTATGRSHSPFDPLQATLVRVCEHASKQPCSVIVKRVTKHRMFENVY